MNPKKKFDFTDMLNVADSRFYSPFLNNSCPVSMAFRELLSEFFGPTVMLALTQAADSIISRNNLTAAELLHPLRRVYGLNGTFLFQFVSVCPRDTSSAIISAESLTVRILLFSEYEGTSRSPSCSQDPRHYFQLRSSIRFVSND